MVDFRLGEMDGVTSRAFDVMNGSKLILADAEALNVGGDIIRAQTGSFVEANGLVAIGAGRAWH